MTTESRRKGRGWIVIIWCLLSAGCAMYRTEYIYQPPQAPEAQACLGQCQTLQLQCDQMQDMKREHCEYREQLDVEDCAGDKDCERGARRDCYFGHRECDERYDTCFQACGGTIEPVKICVFGCPKEDSTVNTPNAP